MSPVDAALVEALTFQSDSGNRMHIITAMQVISGEGLKYRNGLRIRRGDETSSGYAHLATARPGTACNAARIGKYSLRTEFGGRN